jgi:signal transduction histidine kinase
MGAWGLVALAQKEALLQPAAQRETRAYGHALGLAFEYAIRDLQRDQIQRIVNEASREPSIYGALVYDSEGQLLVISDSLKRADATPPDSLKPVLIRGKTIEFEREMENRNVYSVISPIRDAARGKITGALEIAQPFSVMEAEKAASTQRFLLNTVTLLIAVTLLTVWLVRRLILRPLHELVRGARALSGGDLAYRISEKRTVGELTEVAMEFNSMAGRLEEARSQVLREAEERVELERRLRDAEKLAGVGRVAAGLAHEVAAPLNVISGRAEMMLREEMPRGARERNLRIIVDQIARITTIIRSRLDFARRREPRMGLVDLAELADQMGDFLSAEFSARDISFARQGAEEAWVKGDADLLHQALTNLTLNAVHAVEEIHDRPRQVTIRVSVSEPVPEARAGHVVVEIADNGQGIPSEVLSRIFEPFFTTKPRGTGLGLALTRSIIADHGGAIEVMEPAPGELGARFRITLAAAERTVPIDV